MAVHTELSPSEAADRLALRELFDAYAHCADRRDGEGQKALFTDDTRFAADDQGSATNVNLIDNGVEDLRLGLAPDQVGNVIDRDRGGHRLRIGLFLGSPE